MENTNEELSTQNNTEEKLTFFQLIIGLFLLGLYWAIIIRVCIVVPALLTIYVNGWFGLLYIIAFPLFLATWLAPFALSEVKKDGRI